MITSVSNLKKAPKQIVVDKRSVFHGSFSRKCQHSTTCRLRVDYVSSTCRLRVLQLITLIFMLFTIGTENVWGTDSDPIMLFHETF